MATEWQYSKLENVITVNPSRPLSKGADSVYISMQQVESANRKVSAIDHRAFKGSGSRFQNGDTLLARITPCLENGKTAYVDFLEDADVAHGSTEFIILSGIEGVSDDLFVYYLARFPEFRNFAIVRMEGSSGRQRVPAPTLKRYAFSCPPYDEQRAIAHILGSLDDKIELNRRINTALEAMARTIFKSWFVDFLPVRAKMAAANKTPYVLTLPAAEKGKWFVYAIECYDGSIYIGQTEDLRQRWQQHSSGKGGRWTKGHPPVRIVHWELLPSRQETIEREKWLKTGYGRKWLKQTIAAASARTQTGDPVRTKAEGRDPLSACGHAQAGGLPDEITELFPDSFQDSDLGEIPKEWEVGVVSDLGEVICGKTPPTKDPENYGGNIPFITIPDMHGKVFVTKTGKRLSAIGANTQANKFLPENSICVSCIATPGLVVITSERAQTNQQINSVIPRDNLSSYYCYELLQRLGDQIRSGGSGGSVFSNLNKTRFSELKVLLPAPNSVALYHKVVKPLFKRILANQRETTTLASLRDTLLPKLITGELRLPAAALEELAAQAGVPDAEKFVESACALHTDRDADL